MYKLIMAVAATTLFACNASNTKAVQTTDSSKKETTTPADDGFVSLFDGKTTKGWHTYGKSGVGKAWKAADGVLYLDTTGKKDWQTAEGGDIVTDEEYDNFHLKLDWKIAPKGNSGVVFFIKEEPQYQYMWHTGPEMQILDNGTGTTEGHPDGKITSHRAGDLYDLIVAKEVVKPAGEWNTAEIVSNNGKLEFYLNGQQTLSTTMWDDNWKALIAKSKFKGMAAFGTIKKGRICLQDHGDNVWFRNIMIKKL
ncbi:MAG TPA: DUF1080 domain-containing protein [Flavisolibacter sp.]|nr:DUF1080 domain-containing protein [Flavisolibacter sp.]